MTAAPGGARRRSRERLQLRLAESFSNTLKSLPLSQAIGSNGRCADAPAMRRSCGGAEAAPERRHGTNVGINMHFIA